MMDRPKSSAKKTNQMQNVLRTWKENAKTRQSYSNRSAKLMNEYVSYTAEEDASKLDILKELCQMGADLNHLEKERGFACIPCVFWCENLIKFFLDRGLNVNFADEEGDTVLHLTIRNGKFDSTAAIKGPCPNNNTVNVIRFLLLNSANPNLTNTRGETALTLLLAKLDSAPTKKSIILEVAIMLVESGAKCDANSWKSNGELMLLNGYKHFSIVNHCRKTYGNGTIDVDARTTSLEYSKTPLMLAAAKDKMSSCRMLIKMGVDVNARDLQGFTALHHSFNDITLANSDFPECAKLLIKMGADPDAESNSGRNCYDVYQLFSRAIPKLDWAAPSKQVEILEIMGANEILGSHWIIGEVIITSWDRAIDICREFGLEPSEEFVANYEFIRENRNNREASREIRLTAMKTIARLSKGSSKLWNLLMHIFAGQLFFDPDPSHFFDILDFLSEELKRVGDFSSLDEDDFKNLLNLIMNFLVWLNSLIKSESKNEFTCKLISHVHSISRLTIACFEKLMHETGSKNILSQKQKEQLYVHVCFILTLIHSGFDDVISQTQFHENARLLRTLINLDPRDRDGNSLLHLILKNDLDTIETKSYYSHYSYTDLFGTDLMCVLLDFVDIRTRNLMGYEPVQLLYTEKDSLLELDRHPSPRLDFGKFRDVLIKMANIGAHVDAKNVRNGLTLRNIFRRKLEHDVAFRHDNLQCACARVLARSTVPYVNRVPKQIVDFIRAH